jgi:predicted RNA binding protein with dsRBD fold (UPF0201 family)
MPESDEVQIDIETDIHPTESLPKLKKAITNLFPDARFDETEDGMVRATSKVIGTLKEKLGQQQIRDAARAVLLKGTRPGHLYFVVSKQAAFAGKVSFNRDGPLGDIVVIIRTDRPEAIVDLLTDKKEEVT